MGMCFLMMMAALVDITTGVLTWDRFITSTWISLWNFIVFGIVFYGFFSEAVVMNRTMRSMSVSMVAGWKDMVKRVFMNSVNVELTHDEVVEDQIPPVFLSDIRVQLDNHLRGLLENLDYLTEAIESRERPLSFLGVGMTATFRNRSLISAVAAIFGIMTHLSRHLLGDSFSHYVRELL